MTVSWSLLFPPQSPVSFFFFKRGRKDQEMVMYVDLQEEE